MNKVPLLFVFSIFSVAMGDADEVGGLVTGKEVFHSLMNVRELF